jgi:hypothetical protein
VLVGPNEVVFTVHEHYICAKPMFFGAACSKEWTAGAEGATKVIRLPKADPWTFSLYLAWTYASNVPDGKGDADTMSREHKRLIKLCVLGDTLDDRALRNQSMKRLVNMDFQMPPKSITWSFEHTPSTSLLRRMLVTFAATRWDRNGFETHISKHHHDFIQSLTVFLMQQTAKDRTDLPSFLEKLPGFLDNEPEV